jgi:hypothetical protein
MSWEKIDKNFIKKLTAQLIGDIAYSDGELEIPCMIRGTGFLFCYSPITRSFIKVNRGREVFIISDELDEMDRVLIFVNPHIVAIEYDELEELGFN